jgi:hypothetical protein
MYRKFDVMRNLFFIVHAQRPSCRWAAGCASRCTLVPARIYAHAASTFSNLPKIPTFLPNCWSFFFFSQKNQDSKSLWQTTRVALAPEIAALVHLQHFFHSLHATSMMIDEWGQSREVNVFNHAINRIRAWPPLVMHPSSSLCKFKITMLICQHYFSLNPARPHVNVWNILSPSQ